MSASLDATFGKTWCRVYVNKHVELGAGQFPSVAKAFASDDEVTEHGQPVEKVGSTDEQAIASMCQYLEGRFGLRRT